MKNSATKSLMFLGLTVIAGLLVSSCQKDTDIPVGVNLPLSDALSAYGQATLDGVKLRVKQINDAGGINGRKIRLEVQDNRGNKADTRSAFKKLAGVDGVVAVIGPITSTNALGAKMDAEQSKTPLISPTATNDTVTANTKYVFRACFNDSFQGLKMATYALKAGIQTAAVMTDRNSDYSKGLSESFKRAFQAGGGQIVADEGYQQKDTDFGTQLVRIKARGAETIFVPGYPPEVPLIIKAAKVIGFTGRLCGADGWDHEAIVNGSGDNIEGCFFMAAYFSGEERRIVKDFVRDMKAVTGRVPGTFEALGYDSMLLLAEALKAGASREQIAAGMRKLTNVEAVTGTISITPTGDAVKSAVILKVVKEKDVYVTKLLATVNP